MEQVQEKVFSLIANQFKIPMEQITRESRLVEDLKADSANVMVLIMDLEDSFGMMVEDEMLSKLKTVGDVIDYIKTRQ
ncbi:MAG: acyl carrier protein [Eubacteriales bacterium]|nr:acyl carrier protein [Eubacteriales bacterium]MDD3882170.1 acyl carrier protein [Eubacteriales bacterium]MDD4513786.1 acyl carrier protein [Eubacteriales bacterium]